MLESPPTFDYTVLAQPHLTDYSGDLWHGAYLRWFEEARIDALRQVGIDYSKLVAIGCGLPVIDLSIHYRLAIPMGQAAIIRSSILKRQRVRITWQQILYQLSPEQKAVEAQITLVPVSPDNRKILRKSPPELENAIAKIMGLYQP